MCLNAQLCAVIREQIKSTLERHCPPHLADNELCVCVTAVDCFGSSGSISSALIDVLPSLSSAPKVGDKGLFPTGSTVPWHAMHHGRGGRLFLDRRDPSPRRLSTRMPHSSLFAVDDGDEMASNVTELLRRHEDRSSQKNAGSLMQMICHLLDQDQMNTTYVLLWWYSLAMIDFYTGS